MTTQVCEACGRGRRDIEWSDERDKILPALVKMQGALENPKKSAYNSHRGYFYADLADVWEACRQPLLQAELAVVQLTGWGERGLELVTTLVHVSGQWIRARLPVLSPTDPQTMGSGLTYARKYGLLTIVGLAPDGDDDDGQAAMGRPRPPQRQQPQRQGERLQGSGQRQGAKPAEARREPSKQQREQPTAQGGKAKQKTATAPDDLALWNDRIARAKSSAELKLTAREAAKIFGEKHPGRQIIKDALSKRRVAIAKAEAAHPDEGGEP